MAYIRLFFACGGKVHHVHRARQVAVTVFYKEKEKEKRFSPSARVQRVLDWAVSKEGFAIDPVIAPDMELALHDDKIPDDKKTALPKSAHIGRYVHHPHHCLALDLWLLLAEGHLTRRVFGAILRRIWALPLPAG